MIIYTLPDGTTVTPDQQFQIGNQKYPGGWLRTAPASDITAAGITMTTAPDPVVPPMPMVISSLGFLGLFTAAEQTAILTAAETDPTIELFLTEMASAGTIQFSDPRVTAGLNYLVSKGLLTSIQAAAIGSGQPSS